MMAKGFASTGDLAEKTISFDEIGRDLYAFTAEGDPNSGIIVGDDGVPEIHTTDGRIGASTLGFDLPRPPKA